jgi:hypothetical protein
MALTGRLLCLALISAGLGTATLATLEPAAAAARGGGPTAIAVGPAGTSYVGFATGGRLARLSPKGHRQAGVPLDRDDPVDGLFVNAAGQIWVDYGTSVSLLGPGGRVLEHFDHDPIRPCAGSPATRYGGITAGGGRVWVANRCDDTLTVYSQRGRRIATVNLPGRDHPRGITYGGPRSGRGATVYVSLPDSGRIVAYRADRVSNATRPWRILKLRRPGGGVRPSPGGIAVDRRGQLTVADLANHAIYLLDTNHDFNIYRTLGHPPRSSRTAGRLRSPSAIAQYAQDGGSLSGNLFIADTGNRRVQRWNTSGWTYWAKKVRAGNGTGADDNDDDDDGLIPDDNDDDDGDDQGTPDGDAGDGPVNSGAPSIVGAAAVGETLTCSPGAWYGAGGPLGGSIRYAYSWKRGSSQIAGATTSAYVVVGADAGAAIACVVTATNNGGSTTATSATVVIGGGSLVTGPANVVAPAISGSPTVGATLTCDTGTWTGADLTYARQWRRDDANIAGATAATYAVVAGDAGTALSCVVTATNAGGAVAVASRGVPVSAAAVDGPVNTGLPTVVGVGSVGSALSCTPGSWTGTGIGHTYAWSRDGAPIAHTASSKYVVLSADVGSLLGCTVTATNADGSATADSAGRMIAGPSGHAPTNLTAPTVSGNPVAGQTLTCDPGTWTGSPSTVLALWQRDGATVANGSWTYVVGAADAGAALRCVVVADNGWGSGAARSAPAAADACVGATGVEINGGATETTSSFVTLTLRAPRGTTTVRIANNPSFTGETVAAFPAGCTFDWVMPSIAGLPLAWSVYVRYGDGTGATYTDSIVVNAPS